MDKATWVHPTRPTRYIKRKLQEGYGERLHRLASHPRGGGVCNRVLCRVVGHWTGVRVRRYWDFDCEAGVLNKLFPDDTSHNPTIDFHYDEDDHYEPVEFFTSRAHVNSSSDFRSYYYTSKDYDAIVESRDHIVHGEEPSLILPDEFDHHATIDGYDIVLDHTYYGSVYLTDPDEYRRRHYPTIIDYSRDNPSPVSIRVHDSSGADSPGDGDAPSDSAPHDAHGTPP